MHIKKSSGPDTLPWGTLQVIVEIFELKPLIDTNCSDWSNVIQTMYLVFPLLHVILLSVVINSIKGLPFEDSQICHMQNRLN